MNNFKKTPDQHKAVALLSSRAKYILLFGGSRSGKTFILVYTILCRAAKAPGSRHVILRYRFNSVKQSVFMDTLPKAAKLCFPELKYKENRSDWFIRLPNGAEIWIAGLDDKERVDKILGKEYCTIYFNESSEISYLAVTTALSRLAQNCPKIPNKAYFDCNPSGKSHWSYKLFVEKLDPETRVPLKFPELYASMIMNPGGNRDNLPQGYLEETLAGLPERQRRRFMDGAWLDDAEGALWKRHHINAARVREAPGLRRIVIGVDPAVTSGSASDSTGIICAGLAADDHYYVLSDATAERATPYEWAEAVCREYEKWHADRVIGEVNNGGDLIEANLRNVNRKLSFKSVRAARGKLTRAEPIAALYEQMKVHHVGEFPELEDEMCNYRPGNSAKSPDRMDALVWALTELSASSGSGKRLISA